MPISPNKPRRPVRLTGPLPGAIAPAEGRDMDTRTPPAYVETDPLKMTKRRTKPTPSA